MPVQTLSHLGWIMFTISIHSVQLRWMVMRTQPQ